MARGAETPACCQRWHCSLLLANSFQRGARLNSSSISRYPATPSVRFLNRDRNDHRVNRAFGRTQGIIARVDAIKEANCDLILSWSQISWDRDAHSIHIHVIELPVVAPLTMSTDVRDDLSSLVQEMVEGTNVPFLSPWMQLFDTPIRCAVNRLAGLDCCV